MPIKHDLRTIKMGALVLALLFAVASTAEARQFKLHKGTWLQARSAQLNVPIFGGIPQKTGGVHVSAAGSSPAQLTVPANVFTGTGPGGPATGFVFALPKTTIVQISTMFNFNGPENPGVFNGGAKGTRPANFGFCPGAAANPGCATPAVGGANGTRHGLLTYTAGPNQFGGTMQMLTGGTGSLSVIVGSAPIRIQHNTIGGLVGTITELPAVNGGSYSNMAAIAIPAGPITSGGICPGGPCGPAGNGVIAIPGTLDGSGTNSTNTNTGFPWTTGMVYGLATEDLPTQPSTFTSTGSDNRTGLGEGNITLVAGGISYRNPANSMFIQMDSVKMELRADTIPSISPPGIAALAGLMILGAGYATRRRFAKKD